MKTEFPVSFPGSSKLFKTGFKMRPKVLNPLIALGQWMQDSRALQGCLRAVEGRARSREKMVGVSKSVANG